MGREVIHRGAERARVERHVVPGRRDLGLSYIESSTDDLVWSPDLNHVHANTLGYEAVKHTRPFPDWNVVTTRANDPRSKYPPAKHQSDAGRTVPTNFAAENGATTADLFRGTADYGNVIYTRRHHFVGAFLYELPFGGGRRFGNRIGRGLDALVGGWDVTGVTLFQSGPFLTPFLSNADRSGAGTTVRGFTTTQRPDQVGDATLDNPTADRYFNPDAFVRPADNIGRFGGAGVGILEGPGTSVFSMTFGEALATGGVSRLLCEVAFSNLFNLENLGVPNMNITSSAFGRITGTQTVDQAGPRTVQVSLRYLLLTVRSRRPTLPGRRAATSGEEQVGASSPRVDKRARRLSASAAAMSW